MTIENFRSAIGEVFAGRMHGLRIFAHDFVERGDVYMNRRDFEDVFTERPTRSDYEAQLMLDAAAKLATMMDLEVTV